VAAIENRRLDPQTPKWGLKSEKRIICGNYRKYFKEYVFKPSVGGLGVRIEYIRCRMIASSGR